MKSAIFAALLLALTACHGKMKIVPPANNLQDKTIYDCGSNTPRTIFGDWHKFYGNDSGFSVAETLSISASSLTVTAECTYPDGFSDPVSVTVQSQANSTDFTVFESAQNTSQHMVDGTVYNCPVSITPFTTKYHISGKCLSIVYNGQGRTYVQ